MLEACQTALIGTTSQPWAILIHLQDQLATEPETTQAPHTIMVLGTPYTQVRAADSTTTTAMEIRHTSPSEGCGNCKIKDEGHHKRCP